MINIKTHREYKRDISKETHYCVFCLNKVAHYWSQVDIEGKPVSTSLWHCQTHRYAARATLFRDHQYKTLDNRDQCFCQSYKGTCTCAKKFESHKHINTNTLHSVSITYHNDGLYDITFYRAHSSKSHTTHPARIRSLQWQLSEVSKRIVIVPGADFMTVDYLFV